MNKIGWLQKFNEVDVADYMSEINKKIAVKYDEVIRMAIDMYLGRPFSDETDAHRFELVQDNLGKVTELKADGITIGKLTQEWGNHNDDFMQNKISFKMTFTPTRPQTAFDTPQQSK
jgi:hypothetical protein